MLHSLHCIPLYLVHANIRRRISIMYSSTEILHKKKTEKKRQLPQQNCTWPTETPPTRLPNCILEHGAYTHLFHFKPNGIPGNRTRHAILSPRSLPSARLPVQLSSTFFLLSRICSAMKMNASTTIYDYNQTGTTVELMKPTFTPLPGSAEVQQFAYAIHIYIYIYLSIWHTGLYCISTAWPFAPADEVIACTDYRYSTTALYHFPQTKSVINACFTSHSSLVFFRFHICPCPLQNLG